MADCSAIADYSSDVGGPPSSTESLSASWTDSPESELGTRFHSSRSTTISGAQSLSSSSEMDLLFDEDDSSETDLSEMWRPFVHERFLAYSDDEERPIWGWILHAAQSHQKGYELIGPDEELLDFLGLYFTSDEVDSVRLRLEKGANSPLGSAYVKRGVFCTFVEEMLKSIIDNFTLGAEASSPHQQIACDCEETPGENLGTPQIGRVLPLDPHRNLTCGLPGVKAEDPSGKIYFQAVETVELWMSHWDSPLKVIGERGRPSLAKDRLAYKGELRSRSSFFQDEFPEAARIFHYEPKVQVEATRKFDYELGELDDDSLVYLFHGTRISCLSGFEENGIDPKTHESDFSRTVAFYVTNSLRYAYEHVILNRPRSKGDWDSVAVYCFLVSVGELHGQVPISHDRYHLQTEFHLQREKWTDFLHHNWRSGPSSGTYPIVDVNIGPVSVPRWEKVRTTDQREEILYKRMYDSVKIDNVAPLQIAFHSKEALAWLASKLVVCYKEYRERDASQ